MCAISSFLALSEFLQRRNSHLLEFPLCNLIRVLFSMFSGNLSQIYGDPGCRQIDASLECLCSIFRLF